MKNKILSIAIITLLSLSTLHAEESFKVSAFVIDVPQSVTLPNELGNLLETKGVEIGSLPMVTIGSGETGAINVVHQMKTDRNQSRFVDIDLSITPTITNSKISFSGDFRMMNIEGFINYADGANEPTPVYRPSQAINIKGDITEDELFVIDLGATAENQADIKTQTEPQRFLLLKIEKV